MKNKEELMQLDFLDRLYAQQIRRGEIAEAQKTRQKYIYLMTTVRIRERGNELQTPRE
jgi:hypothetical protein